QDANSSRRRRGRGGRERPAAQQLLAMIDPERKLKPAAARRGLFPSHRAAIFSSGGKLCLKLIVATTDNPLRPVFPTATPPARANALGGMKRPRHGALGLGADIE